MKIILKNQSAIYPVPVILVTCINSQGRNNIITVALTTNIGIDVPSIGIVINGEKYSSGLIKETKEFAVNIPDCNILKEVDICGETHGDVEDKFKLTKFTPEDAVIIKSKLIKECPVNFECKLKEVISYESSNLFIGEVVKVHINDTILNENGKINYLKLNPILYAQKTYWSLKEKIGSRGFSHE